MIGSFHSMNENEIKICKLPTKIVHVHYVYANGLLAVGY